MKKILKPYIILPALALLVSLLVLFIPPYPGVSDHGDFHRIMSVTGIHVESEAPEVGKSGFVQTRYEYDKFPFESLLQTQPTSSIVYPIAACRVLKWFGMPYFSTHALSVVLVLLYCLAFFLFVFSLYKIKPVLAWIAGVLGIWMLFDAGYLVFTNSLYQEAVMFIGMFLVLSTCALILIRKPKLGIVSLILFWLACMFFMLSKAQVISLLPIVGVLFGILGWKYARSTPVRICTILGLCVMIVLTVRFYNDQRLSQGKCTTYNSIFYGILMDSKNPQQDLEELGLPPELIADRGKHSFLPTEDYVCPPYSPQADEMIYEKVSTVDVALFYLKHPTRLMDAMQYTASQSFDTTSFLGKYEQYQVPEYTEKIGRFTSYSDLRKSTPKNIYFLLVVFLLVLAYCVWIFARFKGNPFRSLAVLLLAALLLCLFQFPLPVIGNGHADTLKQMYLFNYSFDCGILLWLSCVVLQITEKLQRKSNKIPVSRAE